VVCARCEREGRCCPCVIFVLISWRTPVSPFVSYFPFVWLLPSSFISKNIASIYYSNSIYDGFYSLCYCFVVYEYTQEEYKYKLFRLFWYVSKCPLLSQIITHSIKVFKAYYIQYPDTKSDRSPAVTSTFLIQENQSIYSSLKGGASPRTSKSSPS